MRRFVWVGVLALACDRDPADVPAAPILSPPGANAANGAANQPANGPAVGTTTGATSLAALSVSSTPAPRRGYGPVDMKLSPCMSMENDHTIAGKGCTTNIVVFGPYVGVPADSDVDISFEVETKEKVAIVSDVVSNSAQQFHGSLLEQWVDAGQKRAFGYRVHVFKPVASLESRIFMRADTPVDFKIRDLVVNVH